MGRGHHFARSGPFSGCDGDSLCDALLQLHNCLRGREPAQATRGTGHAGNLDHLVQQLDALLDHKLVVGRQDGWDVQAVQMRQQQPMRFNN